MSATGFLRKSLYWFCKVTLNSLVDAFGSLDPRVFTTAFFIFATIASESFIPTSPF